MIKLAWNFAFDCTLIIVPFMSGLDSFPVKPFILDISSLNASMWSKERFSIIKTTMCFRLSNPAGGIYTPNDVAENGLALCE